MSVSSSKDELAIIFIKELLDALDDIQHDVPIILNNYLDSVTDETECPNSFDIELLAMNILNLRDSVKQLCLSIPDKDHAQQQATINYDITPAHKQFALTMFFHMYMLTDETSIYHSDIINNPDVFISNPANL